WRARPGAGFRAAVVGEPGALAAADAGLLPLAPAAHQGRAGGSAVGALHALLRSRARAGESCRAVEAGIALSGTDRSGSTTSDGRPPAGRGRRAACRLTPAPAACA